MTFELFFGNFDPPLTTFEQFLALFLAFPHRWLSPGGRPRSGQATLPTGPATHAPLSTILLIKSKNFKKSRKFWFEIFDFFHVYLMSIFFLDFFFKTLYCSIVFFLSIFRPCRPPTANRQPPTANRQPPTANRKKKKKKSIKIYEKVSTSCRNWFYIDIKLKKLFYVFRIFFAPPKKWYLWVRQRPTANPGLAPIEY